MKWNRNRMAILCGTRAPSLASDHVTRFAGTSNPSSVSLVEFKFVTHITENKIEKKTKLNPDKLFELITKP